MVEFQRYFEQYLLQKNSKLTIENITKSDLIVDKKIRVNNSLDEIIKTISCLGRSSCKRNT